MKTKEITLKKKILLVELPMEKEIINPEDWYIDKSRTLIFVER